MAVALALLLTLIGTIDTSDQRAVSVQHIFRGTVSQVTSATLGSDGSRRHFATVLVDAVEKGDLAVLDEPTVESDVELPLVGQQVRFLVSGDFRVLHVVDDSDGWPAVRAALRANWLSSSWLREESEPAWTLSLKRALTGVVVLTRDVSVQECSWLERDLRRGERFRVYHGHTYGTISPAGVAVQLLEADDDGPFMEVPLSALRGEGTL